MLYLDALGAVRERNTWREIAKGTESALVASRERERALKEALRELVECKELKREAARVFNAKPVAEWSDADCAEYDRLVCEYARRKPLAWEAAFKALDAAITEQRAAKGKG